MAEALTFSTFSPIRHSSDELMTLGGGVVPEMAETFGVDLDHTPLTDALGDLIRAVGPSKELQANIEHAVAKLGDTALATSVDWVRRSGLLLPVSRSFMDADAPVQGRVDVAVIRGGVRNWMSRRAAALEESDVDVGRVLLAGASRPMGGSEGPDVTPGMLEHEYLTDVVAPRLNAAGFRVDTVAVDTRSGSDVARAITEQIGTDEKVLSVGTAGEWVQGGGQLRRALRERYEGFDEDGSQVMVVAPTFSLGETGTEPRETHQHPITALGIVARGAQEFSRHIRHQVV